MPRNNVFDFSSLYLKVHVLARRIAAERQALLIGFQLLLGVGCNVQIVARFAKRFGRPPQELGPKEIRAFQVHLVNQQVSFDTLRQYVGALRFLYRVTLGKDWTKERIPLPNT